MDSILSREEADLEMMDTAPIDTVYLTGVEIDALRQGMVVVKKVDGVWAYISKSDRRQKINGL